MVDDDDDDPVLLTQDGQPVDTWREGYPYGTIKRFMEHLNPRGAQVVALEAGGAGVNAVVLPAVRGAPAVGRGDRPVRPVLVIKSNDKKRARIQAMRYVLTQFEYENKDAEVVGVPDPLLVGRASRLFEDDERPTRQFPQL